MIGDGVALLGVLASHQRIARIRKPFVFLLGVYFRFHAGARI